MEVLIDLRSLAVTLSNQLETLIDAVTELNNIIDSTAKSLGQLDQIMSLHAIKSKIMREVQNEQLAESEAERNFNRNKIFTDVISFSVGSLIAAALNHKHPLSIGAKTLRKELEKRVPFGSVLIAIGNTSTLEDIKVIAVSRLARERNTTVSD